jgi:hypothetical protein
MHPSIAVFITVFLANFSELSKSEVQLRRILIPRTPVNKPLGVYMPVRFIADSSLLGIVAHKVCGRKEDV